MFRSGLFGLALALVAAACGGGDGDAAPTSTTLATTTTTVAPTTTAAPTTTTEVPEVVDCTGVATGVSDFVLDAGGAEHDVRVYVPTTFDGASRLALVFNFHGYASNGTQQAAVTGYEDLAEAEGFIVAQPTAVPSTGSSLNSWEIADFDDPAKDDVAFTNALLDLLIDDYCVDENRVYATGMSGGGMFTSRLVCDMADRLAAAMSVAAISYSDSCDPARAVPYRAIHGTEDPTVPFDGDFESSRLAAASFAEGLLSRVIPDEFQKLAVAMGCDPEGEREQQSTDVVTTTYSGCDDDVPVVFYEVVDGGHAWPSSPLSELLTAIQGYITFEIDATADGWAFFQEHTLEG